MNSASSRTEVPKTLLVSLIRGSVPRSGTRSTPRTRSSPSNRNYEYGVLRTYDRFTRSYRAAIIGKKLRSQITRARNPMAQSLVIRTE